MSLFWLLDFYIYELLKKTEYGLKEYKSTFVRRMCWGSHPVEEENLQWNFIIQVTRQANCDWMHKAAYKSVVLWLVIVVFLFLCWKLLSEKVANCTLPWQSALVLVSIQRHHTADWGRAKNEDILKLAVQWPSSLKRRLRYKRPDLWRYTFLKENNNENPFIRLETFEKRDLNGNADRSNYSSPEWTSKI